MPQTEPLVATSALIQPRMDVPKFAQPTTDPRPPPRAQMRNGYVRSSPTSFETFLTSFFWERKLPFKTYERFGCANSEVAKKMLRLFMDDKCTSFTELHFLTTESEWTLNFNTLLVYISYLFCKQLMRGGLP